jgi:hypothetical protein
MDFVHDQLAPSRKLRVLTIIDTFSHFSPAIEPRFTFRGPDVVEILEEVGRQVGFPKTIRVDQGARGHLSSGAGLCIGTSPLNLFSLNHDMIGHIPSAVGLEPNKTQIAISVGIPGLLAILWRRCATRWGAEAGRSC